MVFRQDDDDDDDDDAIVPYVNDLEELAFDCLPELAELKRELCGVEDFNHVMMSGSGTSLFCIGELSDKERFEKEFGERDGLLVVSTEIVSREEEVWLQPWSLK